MATEHPPITLEILEGPEQTIDADGWEHFAYRVKLSREGFPSMEVPWRAGLAITEDPNPESVLESMLMDCSGYDPYSFEEWAKSLGYDTDSRKAYAIFEEIGRQAKQLEALLRDDFYPATTEGDSDTNARRLVRGLDLATGLEV